MTSTQDKIDRTYGTSDLARKLLSSLGKTGLDLSQLTTKEGILVQDSGGTGFRTDSATVAAKQAYVGMPKDSKPGPNT